MNRSAQRPRRSVRESRGQKAVRLNLVSLMDVFTILVFFLLVNSGDVQQPSGSQLKLPAAKAATPITESLVIAVNERGISVQGHHVADVSEVLASQETVIEGLLEELQYQLERTGMLEAAAADRVATVMGDREIPFALLQRIIATANEAGYGRISLAVIGEPLAKG